MKNYKKEKMKKYNFTKMLYKLKFYFQEKIKQLKKIKLN